MMPDCQRAHQMSCRTGPILPKLLQRTYLGFVTDRRQECGQNLTFASTSKKMLEALVSPWSCLGAVAGLLLAMAVQWVAPGDVDTVQVGAWLVGIGWIAGLAWDFIGRGNSK
jgi:hypothetical protein